MLYSELCKTYERLESTTKRLDKTFYMEELIKETPLADIQKIILLLHGRVFPMWSEEKIGVASRLMIKALSKATGLDTKKIEDKWKHLGDLGLVASETIRGKKQATLSREDLTINKVFENIKKLSSLVGEGTVEKKVAVIAELLTSASPTEAKYIVRTVLEDMRVGIGEGTIRDALVWAFFAPVKDVFNECANCKRFMPRVDKCISCGAEIEIKKERDLNHLRILDIKDDEELLKKDLSKYDLIISSKPRETYNFLANKVQEAIDVQNDAAEVACLLKKDNIKGLEETGIEVGRPIKVMLFQKADSIEEAFETVGRPCAFEYKFDGFRMLINKDSRNIRLFTRRLEDVTKQFPDVVEVVRENIKDEHCMLDSEVIGIDPKTRKWLPFQNISQRIKRKYDIEELVKSTPVMVNLFDAIMVNDKSILNLPFKERRKLLEKIAKPEKDKMQLAPQIVTDGLKKAEEFYQESLAKGNEGIMAKSLDSPYKPGSRVGYGVKIKPVMETLDLVIVGAEQGTGKRSSWLSSYYIACVDEKSGELLDIGKVSTGLKEKPEEGTSFEELTKLLKPLIISEEGKTVKVKPKIIIEVNYEEIQKSPEYSSGFALRFPRFVRLRIDKSVRDASSIDLVKDLAESQRARKKPQKQKVSETSRKT